MWRVPSGQGGSQGRLPSGFPPRYASEQRRQNMEPSPGPWISALRHSHERLRAGVEPLGLAQLEQLSYASEWSIAQVLSHLGSQAEIFGLFVNAGLSGSEPPGQDAFVPIWEVWNAKTPQAQASDALDADQATVARFESMGA